MRCSLIGLICVCFFSSPLFADGPTTGPATRPARARVVRERPNRERTVIATTGPIAVPYKLTETNHILIRLKINGKGPFNFIVDTGAPLMILRVSAADKLGLKPDSHHMAYLKQLDVEGGISMRHVQCMVTTPFQIEGMNAIGAASVDLDGMLGYGVLARFLMQIDMSQDHMIWTPSDYSPLPSLTRSSMRNPGPDPNEDRLESMGGLLKVLGPFVKPIEMEAKHRGMTGIELSEADGGVAITHVFGNSPAEKAGIKAGDRLMSVEKTTITTVDQAQQAMSKILPGQTVNLAVGRDDSVLRFKIISAEGL